MRWGIEHEADARAIYEDSRGVIVDMVGFVKHPKYDFMGCTPDGVIGTYKANGGLLEIKCPQAKAHFEYLRNGIPPKYFAQVQFQMMVTGAKWCDFMTFNPTFPDQLKAKVFRIEADADYQADLLDRCIQLDGLVSKIVEEVQS
jgi:predicted phage-related endonuclease